MKIQRKEWVKSKQFSSDWRLLEKGRIRSRSHTRPHHSRHRRRHSLHRFQPTKHLQPMEWEENLKLLVRIDYNQSNDESCSCWSPPGSPTPGQRGPPLPPRTRPPPCPRPRTWGKQKMRERGRVDLGCWTKTDKINRSSNQLTSERKPAWHTSSQTCGQVWNDRSRIPDDLWIQEKDQISEFIEPPWALSSSR